MPETNLKDLCSQLLCGHLSAMCRRLRQLPEDKWDWTPDAAAPTARILAAHIWQWLICDRQHIVEPDATKHAPVPEPPRDPNLMCDALEVEIQKWKVLLAGLSLDDLAQPRGQFNQGELNVEWLVGHMLQNCIYKHGQFATLYFALGLDGTAPYDAPFPNTFYEMLMNRTLE
jgi:hypothetical protein